MSNVEFHCPRCKKRVSLPDSLAGRASICPKCHEWLVVPKRSERFEKQAPPSSPPRVPEAQGRLLDAMVEQDVEPGLALAGGGQRHDPRGSVALGGWSCLLISMLLMVFAPPAAFVYLPLVGVAFVLGIVTMAKGHAIQGQLLLIATLVLPVLVAMKFLGMELSQITRIDQWVKIPAAVSVVDSDVEPDENGLSSAFAALEEEADSMNEPSAETGEWTAQARAIEQSITQVETDWDHILPDQEPNWEDRVDYWADQYRGRFVAPQGGMYVKLRLLNGGGAEGTLRDIGPASVTLQVPRGWVTYEKDRLAPESRRNFFAEDFARHYAARKVRIEQEQFQSRRGVSADAMSSRL